MGGPQVCCHGFGLVGYYAKTVYHEGAVIFTIKHKGIVSESCAQTEEVPHGSRSEGDLLDLDILQALLCNADPRITLSGMPDLSSTSILDVAHLWSPGNHQDIIFPSSFTSAIWPLKMRSGHRYVSRSRSGQWRLLDGKGLFWKQFPAGPPHSHISPGPPLSLIISMWEALQRQSALRPLPEAPTSFRRMSSKERASPDEKGLEQALQSIPLPLLPQRGGVDPAGKAPTCSMTGYGKRHQFH